MDAKERKRGELKKSLDLSTQAYFYLAVRYWSDLLSFNHRMGYSVKVSTLYKGEGERVRYLLR